ncbi:hypothetical protein [Dactylosporangium sp. CA-092794]|uniref:hypothetical protein n=1 Tax=Dactylosporangium sp. CA-092794 TaxID=3239929 RepID=UPI003D8DFCE5
MAEKVRGSELLKHRYTERDLEELITLGHQDGIDLVDFFPLGIPNPDGGWGVWRVRPEVLGGLIDRLIQLERVPNFKVFPKGIPSLDAFDVVFEAGSGRRR